MTWERFSYICRKANTVIDQSNNAALAIEKIENEQAINYYGKPIAKNSIQGKLLSTLKTINEPEKVNLALVIYGDLGLASRFSEPLQFKRANLYLIYLTVVFFVTSVTYQAHVMPTFISMFDKTAWPLSPEMIFYRDYSNFLILVVAIVLIASIYISYQFRQIFKFKNGIENNLIFRTITPKSIRKSYFNLLSLLYYPVRNEQQESAINQHLNDASDSGLNISQEMRIIIEVEMKCLMTACEKYIRILSSLVAIAVVIAVFNFLSAAYAPLFITGDAI